MRFWPAPSASSRSLSPSGTSAARGPVLAAKCSLLLPALCIISTGLSIAAIVLVQLNDAIAPRMWWKRHAA